MNNQNLRNKFLIYKYVKNYFSFHEDSLKLFKYRLFQKPFVSKEYKKIIKDAEGLRVRVDLKSETLELQDSGWNLFKSSFVDFYLSIQDKLSYKDFRKNKVNGVKIKKALVKFYANNFFSSHRNLGIYPTEKQVNFIKKKLDVSSKVFVSFYYSQKTISICEDDEEKGLEYSKIPYDSDYVKFVEIEVMERLEKIGAVTFPKSGVQLVLSLNFADWFLASTAEKWTSCISLESDYEEAFWSGLPGLIGDKNRALLYITDGKQKDYYGIKVDRIIARSWILTVRQKSDNKTFFSFVGSYPIHADLEELAKKYFEMKFISKGEKFISRYYAELLYHKVMENGSVKRLLSWGYNDNVKLKIATKNKAKHMFGKYAYFKGYYTGGHPNHTVELVDEGRKGGELFSAEHSFCIRGGLSSLFNMDRVLTEYYGNYDEDDEDYEEDEYYEEEDEYYEEEDE